MRITTIFYSFTLLRTHDGKEIVPDGQRVRVISQPDGTHALLLSDAKPSDAGKYGVIAINDKGETGSTADVAVASKYLYNKCVYCILVHFF